MYLQKFLIIYQIGDLMNIKSYPKPVLFFDNDVKNFEEIEIYTN